MSTQRMTLLLIGAFLLGAGVASVFHMELPKKPVSKSPFEQPLMECTMLKAYDGDTVGCDVNHNGRIDNREEHIRLLGIDATEMHWSPKNHTGKDEPYAKEAMDFVEEKALDKPIYL